MKFQDNTPASQVSRWPHFKSWFPISRLFDLLFKAKWGFFCYCFAIQSIHGEVIARKNIFSPTPEVRKSAFMKPIRCLYSVPNWWFPHHDNQAIHNQGFKEARQGKRSQPNQQCSLLKMNTGKLHFKITILTTATKFYPSLDIWHRSNMNTNKLTCVFICQYNKCAWNVSSSVETHHLCFHISIGGLKKKKVNNSKPELHALNYNTLETVRNFATRAAEDHHSAPSSWAAYLKHSLQCDPFLSRKVGTALHS